MSDLISRVSDALLDPRDGELFPRAPRRIARAVDAEVGRGLVRAARAQADAYVAHTRVEGASLVARTGLARVAELSHEAARFTAQSPTAAGRFEAVADAFAAIVVNEIIKLGYER